MSLRGKLLNIRGDGRRPNLTTATIPARSGRSTAQLVLAVFLISLLPLFFASPEPCFLSLSPSLCHPNMRGGLSAQFLATIATLIGFLTFVLVFHNGHLDDSPAPHVLLPRQGGQTAANSSPII